ncbi:hypothetical protein C8J57DRAFT_1528301 [Mycena rebaudengoi]|nr:hypothetical protein C8J57DRAFT_1528301 [Mycena rebaudengoi]
MPRFAEPPTSEIYKNSAVAIPYSPSRKDSDDLSTYYDPFAKAAVRVVHRSCVVLPSPSSTPPPPPAPQTTASSSDWASHPALLSSPLPQLPLALFVLRAAHTDSHTPRQTRTQPLPRTARSSLRLAIPARSALHPHNLHPRASRLGLSHCGPVRLRWVARPSFFVSLLHTTHHTPCLATDYTT